MTDWPIEDRRRFWTVRQVAEHWHVSVDKVHASLKKGALPFYDVDGSIRIRERDALAYGRPMGMST